ncbi:transposase family protein [Sphingomonas sp. UYP23]
MAVCSVTAGSNCPICGSSSRVAHSRYRRRVADLPLSGRSVRLTVTVRRFWCDAVRCPRRLFAEPFATATLAPWARRTAPIILALRWAGVLLPLLRAG